MRSDEELLALARAVGCGCHLEEDGELERQRKLVRAADTAAGKRLFEPDSRAPGWQGIGSIRNLEIGEIAVRRSRRPLDADKVSALAESIKAVGLISPIVVQYRGRPTADTDEDLGQWTIVAGHHRLMALRDLGAVHAPCLVTMSDDVEAELIEITENLHRAELTALQRSEQVSRWIELTGAKREADDVSRQSDAKPGRPEGGVRSAARELGLSEADARRSVTVASLSPEAKAVAVEAGLDDNRSALLAAAKEPTPERQVEVLRKRGEESRQAPIEVTPPGQIADEGLTPEQTVEVERWRSLSNKEREKERRATLFADFAKIEHLLPEIGGDFIECLPLLRIIDRYKPVLTFDPQWSIGGKGVTAIQRRIRDAQGMVKDAIARVVTEGPTSHFSMALAAYGLLSPDERLAFHEQTATPTAANDDDLPASLLVKMPKLAA